MTFTSFDLSTAEFPDSGFTGSFVDGALVPDFPSDGLIFWLPAMTRDLALWYTLVIDFEVTGDFPYGNNPRANAFAWRNDGDYGSSSTATVGSGDTGRKDVQSLVVQIGDGGDPDECRVGVFVFGGVPPVTGVRWEPLTPAPVSSDTFAAAVPVAFGQTYSIDWAALSTPTTENTALGTPDVLAAVWFQVSMPTVGMLTGSGAPNLAVYTGSSLGGLTLFADNLATAPIDTTGGVYYVRAYATADTGTGFTSFPTFTGYQAATIYGDWVSPNPVDVTFTLSGDGNLGSDVPDTTYLTAQAVAGGVAGIVTTWHTERDTGSGILAPAFVSGKYVGAQEAAGFENPVTPAPPPAVAVGPVPYHVFTDFRNQGVGSGLNGYRDYGAAEARVAWFLSTTIPLSVVVDGLATGWQNQDGSVDTEPTGVATTGALDITVEGVDANDDGVSTINEAWVSKFAAVSGAVLDVDGNVDYDVLSHTDGTTALFSVVAGDAGSRTATVDLTGEGALYGFCMWTELGAAVTVEESGVFGGVVTDPSTFVVTYAVPDYRPRFDGIEVLLPLFGEVTGGPPPLRLTNRTDQFASARSLTGRSQSRQGSNRLTGYL